MRYVLVSAAAVMAITGAAAVGNAQMPDKGQGPGQGPAATEGKGPGAERAQRGPGGGDKAQPSMPNRAEAPERRGAERDAGREQPRAAQKGQPDGDRSKSATQPQRDKDEKRAADQPQRDRDQKKAADRRQDDKDQKRAADRRQDDKDQKRAADRRQDDKDQKRAADRRQDDKDQKRAADRRDRDKDDQKAAEGRKGDQDQRKSAKGQDDRRGDRVQVSQEKRSGVRERLLRDTTRRVDRIDRTRINVDINVGVRIPRSLTLHTLPVSIVSYAPAYRGYRYFVLEDETICIVDPNTYVIVDVIPAGSQRAHLTLARDDMQFIYRTVPKERRADVRVRLALGAEIPREVELLAFPDEVIERVPDVRHYRYIVAEDDIVIVDPDDYAVALVIDR